MIAGLVSLLASAAEAQKLGGEASNFTAGMKNLGATQMATVGRKLAAGAWVAKESPGFIQGLYGSTFTAQQYRAAGANIAGFIKVADAMIAQGVV